MTVQKAESSARRRGITAGVRDRSKRGRMVATLRVMAASGQAARRSLSPMTMSCQAGVSRVVARVVSPSLLWRGMLPENSMPSGAVMSLGSVVMMGLPVGVVAVM